MADGCWKSLSVTLTRPTSCVSPIATAGPPDHPTLATGVGGVTLPSPVATGKGLGVGALPLRDQVKEMPLPDDPTDHFRPVIRPDPIREAGEWGRAVQHARNTVASVKLVMVRAGGVHSLQYHHQRGELWIILDAGLLVEVDGHSWDATVGEEIWIPPGSTHRVTAPGDAGRFIEVSFGHFSEIDVTRLEDAYGRSG
ncbi:MAG: cupin domain-containing protein [Chloroflexi bacterium]|nr:MAG: cupin domain-containing protein [Chloroflexota bacterium]